MQKEYVILNKDNTSPVIISINCTLYLEYLDSGYQIIYQGNKRECEAMMNEEIELSY